MRSLIDATALDRKNGLRRRFDFAIDSAGEFRRQLNQLTTDVACLTPLAPEEITPIAELLLEVRIALVDRELASCVALSGAIYGDRFEWTLTAKELDRPLSELLGPAGEKQMLGLADQVGGHCERPDEATLTMVRPISMTIP